MSLAAWRTFESTTTNSPGLTGGSGLPLNLASEIEGPRCMGGLSWRLRPTRGERLASVEAANRLTVLGVTPER